ncbi:hypothetical protein BHE74_00044687 [Ensete ventricosum]|nr:hypothetical protein BHE74_00044687 [Ensete ventricosum]RZS20069.1 hypothetical protein BHM03_00052554 [Ensete ventricosum]
MLMTNSRASDPTPSECASISPMLSMQWSPDPSSTSWASSSPPSPTSSSPAPPPSPLPLCLRT